MTRSVYNFYSTDETGAVIPLAEISVNFAGGAEAPIYTVNSGGTPVVQPFIATASGKTKFYIEPGVYDVESKDPSTLTTSTFSNEEIGVSRGQLTKDTDVDFYFSTTEDLINNVFDTPPELGSIASSKGFGGKGDGGKGNWKCIENTGAGSASRSPAQLGDALLNDGNGNQWVLVSVSATSKPEVNPLQLGARVSNPDNSLFIQAAINSGKTIHLTDIFPMGATVKATNDKFSMYSVGLTGGFTRSNGAYGNTLEIEATNPLTTTIFDVTLSGLKFDCSVKMTSGAHIRATEIAYSTFEGLSINNGYIGFHGRGLRASFIDKMHIRSGQHFAGVSAGSRYMLLEDSPSLLSYSENVELFISNFNMTTNGSPFIEHGLEVKEADGIWFSNGHVFSASVSNCFLNAAASPQLLGLKFSNVWFDGLTTRSLLISGTTTDFAGFYNFTGCSFTGATTHAVDIQAGSKLDDVTFTGCKTWSIDSATAWNIEAGENINIDGSTFKTLNASNAASSQAIRLGSSVGNVNINGGSIFNSSNLDFGILDNGTDQLTVNSISFKDFNDSAKTIRVIDPVNTIFNTAGCTTDQTDNYVPGNTQRGEMLSIIDDSFDTVDIGTVLGGVMAVSLKFNTTASGMVAFENSGTETITKLSGGANLAVTTGVLNGTTGIDGNLTVSISGTTLYIENRTGVTRNAIWNILSRDFNH